MNKQILWKSRVTQKLIGQQTLAICYVYEMHKIPNECEVIESNIRYIKI